MASLQIVMICIIALVVFSILGIFSVKYRQLAAKAFDCVFRRLTLRPCQSGLDRQVKTSVISFFSKKNVKIARLVAKHFEGLSWFFTILMILSIFFSARGIYFYVIYGNCNGENTNDFCVFDALNPNQAATSCEDPNLIKNTTTFEKPNVGNDPSIGPKDAKVVIIEFGCFSCPYTKKAEPVVNEILKKYENRVLFVYKDFHIASHEGTREFGMAAACANEQDRYWQYHDFLFQNQENEMDNSELIEKAVSLGLNKETFTDCLETKKYANETDADFQEGINAGVYGTPTFFINDKVVVGPKPFNYFKTIIDKELAK
jgi:protein-disulfide isomerase